MAQGLGTPDLGGPNVITRVFIKGKQEVQSDRKICRKHIADFKNGRRDHDPRSVDSLQKLEKARKQLPPWSHQKGTDPRHLHFSPAILFLDF